MHNQSASTRVRPPLLVLGLSVVTLSLFTFVAAAAPDSAASRRVSGVPIRVAIAWSEVAQESPGLPIETGVRRTPASRAVPEQQVGNSRLWLPDTLETAWTAPDKKLHFLACYSIVLTGRISSGETAPGVVGAVALSAAKELWDLWFKLPPSSRGVSKRDLIADALGIGVAVVTIEWLGE